LRGERIARGHAALRSRRLYCRYHHRQRRFVNQGAHMRAVSQRQLATDQRRSQHLRGSPVLKLTLHVCAATANARARGVFTTYGWLFRLSRFERPNTANPLHPKIRISLARTIIAMLQLTQSFHSCNTRLHRLRQPIRQLSRLLASNIVQIKTGNFALHRSILAD
jgi:hypothetical protein